MQNTLTDAAEATSISPPKTREFNIGFMVADPAIGIDAAMYRLLGTLSGELGIGSLNEAFVQAVPFYPTKMSATMPELAECLGELRGTFADIYSRLCKLRLELAIDCERCQWCGSVFRYHVIDKTNQPIALACDQCGHIVGWDWLLLDAVHHPSAVDTRFKLPTPSPAWSVPR